MINSSFCDGTIVHDRTSPKKHRFTYKMSWCLYDLGKIESLFSSSRLWSINKFNLISIRNKDYINSKPESINTKIRKYLKDKTSQTFEGEIYLFTHPRYFGFGFNSVNFYFCFVNNKIKYIVSEINNTPWKEKHLYFHDNSNDLNQEKDNHSTPLSFKFNKEFHISPFIDMDITYHWKFLLTDEQLKISMSVLKDKSPLLNVYLNTQLKTIEEKNISRWTLKKPFQSLKMFSGIYWQAFKLWLKRVPIYDHNQKEKTQSQSNKIKRQHNE